MFGIKWVKYTWVLDHLPDDSPKMERKLELRIVGKEDRPRIWKTLESTHRMDHGWNTALEQRMADLKKVVDAGIDSKKVTFLSLEDGSHMLGLSAIYFEEESERQLLTGVCIQDEYRCRGAGTWLLYQSLHRLAEEGLKKASVITRKDTVADRFLYGKFKGQSEDVESYEIPKSLA
ncbi:MAG: GNAT family N-acetyltransferase [Verrucomicrobiota bacterium]